MNRLIHMMHSILIFGTSHLNLPYSLQHMMNIRVAPILRDLNPLTGDYLSNPNSDYLNEAHPSTSYQIGIIHLLT